MIISREALGEINGALVGRLIRRHINNEQERFKKLMAYYLGEQAIMHREGKSAGLPNTKVMCNHAKYIVDMAEGYMFGGPIKYSPSKGYNIEPLKDVLAEQEITNVDTLLCKHMGIYGKAFELIYINEDGKPRSCVVSPENAFVVYDDSVAKTPIIGVRYYEKKDADGNTVGVEACVYDSENYTKYSGTTYEGIKADKTEPHYLSRVPLIEYLNNEEEQGDFEQLISLIDAYNILASDRVNDKEQFVDAFLFLRGVEVDTEEAKKLKIEKILHGPTDADAKYLSKVLSEADMSVLRGELKEDIHRLSLVPDLSDVEFGSNLSGVAIKYKLFGFDQKADNKEKYFKISLRQRFEIYVEYLSFKQIMARVPSHKVDFDFCRNLPENLLEISQMIMNLKGTVSDETLIAQIPFITDAKEERELMMQQQEQESAGRVKEQELFMKGTGYDKGDDDLDDEK